MEIEMESEDIKETATIVDQEKNMNILEMMTDGDA